MKSYNTPQERQKAPLSIVRGINPKIIAVSTLSDVLADIKSQDWQKAKDMAVAYKNDPPQYKKQKDGLYGFIAGKFSKRDADSCDEYIPLIVLDIDSIESEDETKAIFETITLCAYTYAAFISPSGHGIRILVWCDNTEYGHEWAYHQITGFYSKDLNIKTDVELRKEQGKRKITGEHFDTSAKAFPRFWYYGHNDEFLFVNENATTFELKLGDDVQLVNASSADTPIQDDKTDTPSVKNGWVNDNGIVAPIATPSVKTDVSEPLTLTNDIIIEVVEEMIKKRNVPSGRNNHVFHFAALAVEHGLGSDSIADYCMKFEESDFGASEIAATVKSAIERTQRKYEPIQVMTYYKKMKGIEPMPKKTPPSVKTVATVEKNGQVAIVAPNQVIFKKIDYRATGVYEAMRNDNKFIQMSAYLERKYIFRFNEVSNEVEVSLKKQTRFETLNLNGLQCELMEYGLSSVEANLKAYLGNTNYCPVFDVFVEFFESLPKWDGKDHIAQLAAFVQTDEEEDWWNKMFRKSLLRTAACSMLQTQNRNCLTLFGGQNAGKSRFIRFLVPPQLKVYYKEGLSNPQTKDGKLEMVQNFIINLDDLDGMSKWDVGQLKSLFSLPTVKERPFFGTSPRLFQRRASFFASSNKDDILVDDSGSTRWNIIRIKTINHDNGGAKGYEKNVDIIQVWAQVYAALQAGEKYDLTVDEINRSEKNNKSFQKTSHEHELIMKYYEVVPKDTQDGFFTSSEIKAELERVAGLHSPLNRNAIGHALGMLGVQKVSVRNERFDSPVKGYFIRLRPEFLKNDTPLPFIVEKNKDTPSVKTDSNDDLPF
jgi:hypothetical protein